jgi:hypothetical protein
MPILVGAAFRRPILAAFLLLIVATTTSAQTAKPAPAPTREADALAVLTSELRALRADIAEVSRASLKLQLLTARIQAQEQRIIYLDRQRTEAAARRLDHEQGMGAMASMFTPEMLSKVPPEQRRDLEFMVQQQKTQRQQQEQMLNDLRVKESDAESALSQEQGRWADLNTRLEELEKSLR